MPAEAAESWGDVARLTCSGVISGLKAYAGPIIAYAGPIIAYAGPITAVIAIIISMAGVGYCYRWWRRQRQLANGLQRGIAEIAARTTMVLFCMMVIILVASRYGTNTTPEPITLPAEKIYVTEKIYVAYEPYPILPLVTCPERKSPCHPPNIFIRMKWDFTIRSKDDKSYLLDTSDYYDQPEWAQVADDLRVAKQHDHQVLSQLERATRAVEERDETVSYYMHRAQIDSERLEWSRTVGSDVASGYHIPNKTLTRIFCDFLRDIGNTQEHLFDHMAMTELEQSLYQQQNWTLQIRNHIDLTFDLANSWFRSSDPAKRSLTAKLEDVFYSRMKQDSSHGSDYQKYRALEQDALNQIRRRESIVCERANREDAGEKEEMSNVKIGHQVRDIQGMTWYFGHVVRKGSSHVSADVEYTGPYSWAA
ncbi:hypothetical protein HBI81_165890 [Parastagonospora nodorum]|nr:hypothetical protein HBH52_189240 [Parastagonospora nodorum]KAH3994049.1 hypothetical protein HBI10_194360 [Parastagonospora nodorum]KAH4008705.1 hypothetical protein HBI13_231610 [Parastagonospora nodorum]KAH4045118.1 hypothetical protein HBH49_205130 [Parastagonospora nodorum]KAH4062803.1 hypothetical protein HBH50_202370 [Parastagonospora nodorum]